MSEDKVKVVTVGRDSKHTASIIAALANGGLSKESILVVASGLEEREEKMKEMVLKAVDTSIFRERKRDRETHFDHKGNKVNPTAALAAVAVAGMCGMDCRCRHSHKVEKKCGLPECNNITTHNGGYCCAEHCKIHRSRK